MPASHTPGPWTCSPESDNRVTIWAHSCLLAEVIGVNAEAAKANARLTATSPRMIAALKQAAKLLAELPKSEQTLQMIALRSEIVGTIKEATPDYYGY